MIATKYWAHSKNVQRTDYDPQTETLSVTFNQGKAYQYLKVPPALWAELKDVESIGSFINKKVKGVFECEAKSHD